MMTWIGANDTIAAVDPGIDGALICLDVRTWRVIDVVEMPTLKITKAGRTKAGKKPTRHLVDGPAVRAWLLRWAPAHFVIEQQGARPAQGLASTATTMRQFGLLEGIACGLALPYTLVAPGHWRAACKAPVGKDGSLVACGRLAPQVKAEIEARLKDKTLRIAAADAWGMAHAWGLDNKSVVHKRTAKGTSPELSNEDFFA